MGKGSRGDAVRGLSVVRVQFIDVVVPAVVPVKVGVNGEGPVGEEWVVGVGNSSIGEGIRAAS